MKDMILEGKARPLRNKRQSNLFCDNCRMTGHTVESCYKIHGYQPRHKREMNKKFANLVQIESIANTTFFGSY